MPGPVERLIGLLPINKQVLIEKTMQLKTYFIHWTYIYAPTHIHMHRYCSNFPITFSILN